MSLHSVNRQWSTWRVHVLHKYMYIAYIHVVCSFLFANFYPPLFPLYLFSVKVFVASVNSCHTTYVFCEDPGTEPP